MCDCGSPLRGRGVVFLILAVLAGGPAQAVEDRRCEVGVPVFLGLDHLPGTVRALRRHRPLTVVAIGSSSTQGYGASEPNRAYPAQLAALLKLRFPHSAIHVLNRGVGVNDIDAMIARFPRDVYAARPDLVIWQTGTNDAIDQVPLDRFRALLAGGLKELARRRIDVILMTPQFAPQFSGAADHDRYLEVMRDAGRQAGVALFDRYTPSQAWAADPHFVDSPAVTPDGLHQGNSGYHCVALLLAEHLAQLANAAR